MELESARGTSGDSDDAVAPTTASNSAKPYKSPLSFRPEPDLSEVEGDGRAEEPPFCPEQISEAIVSTPHIMRDGLMISPDAPIQDSKEDLLARTPFASALAKAINQVAGADSFVVGIHGKWGSGKSSVLNLVIEQLNDLDKSRPEEERTHVLRFNPWNFSDQSQLVLQFLRQFRAHLLKSAKAKGEKLGDMAASIAEYAEALSPPLELLPYGSLLSTGFKFVTRGVKTKFGPPLDKDVNSAFEKISQEALKLKRRTAVIIDDIDRLTASETRQIFQLVKLTARFPYVVYLLAFDRTAVAGALQESGIDSGDEYLEKIVQISFDLPPITEATLTLLVTQGIDEILKRFPPAHFDQTQFGNLFYGGLRPSFASLRHARKFINGLEFAFSIVGGELNGVDIIGIEALRLFYPKAYDAVRNNKQIFAGHIDTLTAQKGTQAFTASVDAALANVGELTENLKTLLVDLFPKISFAYGDTTHGHESETFWEKTHRVVTTRYFDAYFQLALGPTEVSVEEVSELVKESGNERRILELFQQLKAKGKIKHAMESLRFRLPEVPSLSLPDLLSALILLGEKAGDEGSPLGGVISEFMHVRWVIFDVLERTAPERRPDLLLEIARTRFAPRTMFNLLLFIQALQSERGAHKEFTEERVTEIRAALVKSIETAAARNSIFVTDETLPSTLEIWMTWGKPEEARAYMRSAARTDGELLDLINRFIYQTHSYGGGNRVGRTHNKLATRRIASIFDIDELLERLRRIDDGRLNQERRDIRAIALKQLGKLKEKGMTPEQFDNSRFFEHE